jgi:hypothetical protein
MTLETEHSTTPSINLDATTTDPCPSWAEKIISAIMVLEVEAGTIKNPSEQNKESDWSTAKLDDLAKVANRLDQQGYQETANEVENLFFKLCQGLSDEGFPSDTIAAMINARIPTGCKLPYCNAQEVQDALN